MIVGLCAAQIAARIRRHILDTGTYPSSVTTLVRNEEGGFDQEEPQPV